MDTVSLTMQVDCIIGILDWERTTPQPLQIELDLWLDLGPCGESGDLAKSVDYAAIDAQARFLCLEGHFRLIESLGLAILRTVLQPPLDVEERAAIQKARIVLAKPTVMPASVPSVQLRRDAAWAASPPVDLPGGGISEPIIHVAEVMVRRVTLPEDATLSTGTSIPVAGHTFLHVWRS